MPRSKSALGVLAAAAAAFAAGRDLAAQAVQFPSTAERWGVFEIALAGPSGGNPYVDVHLAAAFTQGAVTKSVTGFYDGVGTYRIRFMPHLEGSWSFSTSSNDPGMHGRTGSFTCTAASAGNRGPVRLRDQFHFQYEDGTPFHPVGTTAYGWTNQPAARQDQTLQTLAGQRFNKLRFLVMPKYYVYSTETPPLWPFEGGPHAWSFDRPVYAFFQNYDRRVRQLRDMGIEADIILLNPYDGWGLKDLHGNRALEDRYLRYVTARLAAFRNVWWSMSNEYELWDKDDAYWDRVFQLVRDSDPYGHPRSIHNMHQVYDHAKPWVTHASLQQVSVSMDQTRTYRNQYGKPIVWDEVGYEGDIPEGWGRLSPQEMTRRFWLGLRDGSYVGHGETYRHPENILWWSKGGVLHGDSPARIAFLAQLVRDHVPGQKLDPLAGDRHAAHHGTQCYLYYYDDSTATSRSYSMPAGITYRAYVIDTWNMVKTDAGPRAGTFTLSMPANLFMAVLLVQEGAPVPPPPPDPRFVKGINFNGGAVTIEGNPWLSYSQALSSGLSFATGPQVWTSQITPVPAADPDMAAMLNSAVWTPASNLAFTQTLANGGYDVFLWILENHQTNYRSFGLRLEGATAAASVGTLAYGTWQKYGPYRVTVADGGLDVELVHATGDPHVMGMAIFGESGSPPAPPSGTGLLLHWKLDETSGPAAADASGNGNVGTLSDGGPVWSGGRIGGGLDFDGDGDFATAPASPSLNGADGELSVSLWVHKRAAAPTWGAIAGRRSGAAWEDLWLLYYHDSAQDEYSFGLTTSRGTVYLNGPPSAGDHDAWVHLAAVYDGAWMILYRNGQEVARGAHSGSIPPGTSPLVVGAGDNGVAGAEEFVNAVLDDLRIYGRALPADEVAALWAAGTGGGSGVSSSGGSEEGSCGALGIEALLACLLAGRRFPRRRA